MTHERLQTPRRTPKWKDWPPIKQQWQSHTLISLLSHTHKYSPTDDSCLISVSVLQPLSSLQYSGNVAAFLERHQGVCVWGGGEFDNILFVFFMCVLGEDSVLVSYRGGEENESWVKSERAAKDSNLWQMCSSVSQCCGCFFPLFFWVKLSWSCLLHFLILIGVIANVRHAIRSRLSHSFLWEEVASGQRSKPVLTQLLDG